jgi:hypothetical protein
MKVKCTERCKVVLPGNERRLFVAGEHEVTKQAGAFLIANHKQFSAVVSGGDSPVSEGESEREADAPASAHRKTKVPKVKKKGTW